MTMLHGKGKLESEISTAITQFEKEYLGRGPKESKAYIIEDMILVRLKGILTPAEVELAREEQGAGLIKQMRTRLIESSRVKLENIIRDKTGNHVRSLHTDISSRSGERIFIFVMDKNLESQFIE